MRALQLFWTSILVNRGTRKRNLRRRRKRPAVRNDLAHAKPAVVGIAPSVTKSSDPTTPMGEPPSPLILASRRLARAAGALEFTAPVTHVYNPLVYARRSHEDYLERYGSGKKAAIFLGMNPGPFGMAQTGVPFGDVTLVRDFLGIEAPVGKPPREHPKRLVLGFQCPRCEVSGTRIWGWIRDRFGSPERFFARYFVANYCPLAFMEASGKNRTPDQLPSGERERLFAACDEALCAVVRLMAPRIVVAIGGFAEQRARQALAGWDLRVVSVLHPSPANPRANRGWAIEVERELREAGISLELPVCSPA
jgi:single-strand selective monofunctional uracil DNA glycosylase